MFLGTPPVDDTLAIRQPDTLIPPPSATASLSGTAAPRPVWNLAIGWLLLIPMLYIAANGTFIPHAGEIDAAATGQTPGTDATHKISIAFVSLICFLLIAFRFSPVIALAQRARLILVFPLLTIVSSLWSADPQQSVTSGVILLIFTSFAVYVVSRFPARRQFELIMLMGAVALPLSIVLALFVPSIGTSEAGWRGIFGHKQICAAVSIFLMVTALHWECSGAYRRIFRAVYLLMCALLIVMSQSRTGWVLALVAVVITGTLWVLQKMPAKQGLLVVLLAIPVTVAALYVLYVLSPGILTSVGKDSTLSQRTIIWSAAWDAVARRPLQGYGFAAFWKGLYGPSQPVVLVAGWGLQQAQNGFLDVCLGVGLIGLGVVVAITWQGLRNAVRCFHRGENEPYVRWGVVVILCTLLYNIGESSIGLINLNWFLFLLAVIGLIQVARLPVRSRPVWESHG
jgi:exopolysaccharide production protein ExoQ